MRAMSLMVTGFLSMNAGRKTIIKYNIKFETVPGNGLEKIIAKNGSRCFRFREKSAKIDKDNDFAHDTTPRFHTTGRFCIPSKDTQIPGNYAQC